MSLIPPVPAMMAPPPPPPVHPRKKRKFLWKKDSVDEILDWMNLHCLQAIRSVTKEIAEAIKETFFGDEPQVTVVVIQTKFQNLRKQYKAAGEILHGIRSVSEDLNMSVQEAALKECPYYYKMYDLNQKYETQLKAQDAHLYQSTHIHLPDQQPSQPQQQQPQPQQQQSQHQPLQPPMKQLQQPLPHPLSQPQQPQQQNLQPLVQQLPPQPPKAIENLPPLPPRPAYNSHPVYNNSIPSSATALLNAAQSILPVSQKHFLPPIGNNGITRKRSFDEFQSSQPLTPPYSRGPPPTNGTILPPVHSFDQSHRRTASSPFTQSKTPTIASLTNPSQPKPITKSLSSSPIRSNSPPSISSYGVANSSVIGVISDPPLSSLRGTPFKNPSTYSSNSFPSLVHHPNASLSGQLSPPPSSSASEIAMLWQTINDLRKEVTELKSALEHKSKADSSYPSPLSVSHDTSSSGLSENQGEIGSSFSPKRESSTS